MNNTILEKIRSNTPVATINGDTGIITLALDSREDGIHVIAIDPTGSITDLDAPTATTQDEAMETIRLMFGRDGAGVWNLQWIEKK